MIGRLLKAEQHYLINKSIPVCVWYLLKSDEHRAVICLQLSNVRAKLTDLAMIHHGIEEMVILAGAWYCVW